MLRKIDIVMAITAIALGLYYFSIDNFNISESLFPLFLTVFFFFSGLEIVKEDKRKWGYLYIVTALVMFSVSIKEFIGNFL